LPEEVPEVLAEFARLAAQGCKFYGHIPKTPSRKTWNGEQLHMTTQPPQWWQARFAEAGWQVTGNENLDYEGEFQAKL
jgi:hypothetical protein